MALCVGLQIQEGKKSRLKQIMIYLYPVISGLAVAEQMKRTLAPSVTVWGWTERVTVGGSVNRKTCLNVNVLPRLLYTAYTMCHNTVTFWLTL